MDEVHFQQHGSRCRMWVPPETKDPVLLHQPTRKSVGYYGAVRLRDGQFFFRRETGKFNAVTCWEFLKELCATSTRMVLIPMKVVSDSDMIPVTGSEVKLIVFGAKRRWRSYGD